MTLSIMGSRCLADNELEGTIPEELQYCAGLELLDLSVKNIALYLVQKHVFPPCNYAKTRYKMALTGA